MLVTIKTETNKELVTGKINALQLNDDEIFDAVDSFCQLKNAQPGDVVSFDGKELKLGGSVGKITYTKNFK